MSSVIETAALQIDGLISNPKITGYERIQILLGMSGKILEMYPSLMPGYTFMWKVITTRFMPEEKVIPNPTREVVDMIDQTRQILQTSRLIYVENESLFLHAVAVVGKLSGVPRNYLAEVDEIIEQTFAEYQPHIQTQN